jgi:hypothetical protein
MHLFTCSHPAHRSAMNLRIPSPSWETAVSPTEHPASAAQESGWTATCPSSLPYKMLAKRWRKLPSGDSDCVSELLLCGHCC